MHAILQAGFRVAQTQALNAVLHDWRAEHRLSAASHGVATKKSVILLHRRDEEEWARKHPHL